MLPRMVLLLVAVAWLGAALLTATLFALLARAGRADERRAEPPVPALTPT